MSVKTILSNRVALDERFIQNYEELQRVLQNLRDAEHTISMTQGVYDMLHIGHARYLEKAKSLGDILVVAVDTDEYTRKRKQKANERRPVVPFQERLELLANLRCVDILTIRDLAEHEADPDFVIKVVKPDALVMSRSTSDVSSAKHDELRALLALHGGRLEVLEPQASTSTTQTIRELFMDGAGGLVDHIIDAIETYFHKENRQVSFGHREKEGKKE